MNNDYDIVFHEPEEAKPVSKKKIIIIISVVIGVVLLITLTAGLIWYNSPKQKFRRAIDQADYEKAINIQQSENLTVDDRTIGILNDNLSIVKNDYVEGRVGFEDAITKVNLIKKIGGSDVNEKSVEVEQYIKDFDSSNKSYKQAERAFDAKEYANAIILFDEVLEIDTINYTNAQRYKQDAIELYRNEQFSAAKAKADSNDYINAIALLQHSLDVLPGDKLISTRIEEYRQIVKEQEIQTILNAASESVEKGELISAINDITLNISKYNNDERLTKKLEEYTSKYVNEVMLRVEEYEKNKDYSGAITVLSQANTDLPSNTDISNKLSEVQKVKEETEFKENKSSILKEAEDAFNSKDYTKAISILQADAKFKNDSEIINRIAIYKEYLPISLLSLTPTDEYNTSFKSGVKDSRDNSYDNVISFTSDDWRQGGYIEFYTNNKYSKLSFMFVTDKDYSREKAAKIEVYSDEDKCLYSSDEVTYKTEPFMVEVDISETKYITISCQRSDGGLSYGLGGKVYVINPCVQK